MSEKYKREIEEILKKSGDLGEPKQVNKPAMSFWRLIWRSVKRSLGGKAWTISPGRVMLAAACLLMSALIVRALAPGWVGPLAWAGLLLFIIGYGMFFVQPRKIEKRWRGKPLDGPRDSWWDRIRRRLK